MNAAAGPYGATPQTPGFDPTHVVPKDGLDAWAVPDPTVPSVPLDPLLPVQLLSRLGDWGQVLCSNGWSAWVDARLLVPLPKSPPGAGGPLVRTADARRLLARAEETLGRYRAAVEELAAGRTDAGTFHGTTQGLRIGVVVDGEAVWVYDAEHDQWCYCDGTAMTTLAARKPAPPPAASTGSAAGAPSGAPAPGPVSAQPTRLSGGGQGPPPHGPGEGS
ncbi:hypothetical protein ABZ419_04395 [Streptomyces cinnamoneus]|uniref:hypothetical protein n=1 Tax=Streptomyces cinnamoneus TaxID=53446 RepID=UPI0033FCA5BF